VTTPPSGYRSSTPSALRSRYLPVVLDLIVPGLGHLVAGRRKLAAIFGIPFLALVLVALIILATTPGGRLAAEAVNVFWLLLGVQGVVLVWRLLAAGASLLAPGLPRLRVLDAVPVVVLIVLFAGPQVVLGYITNEARVQTDNIFVGDSGSGSWSPSGSVAPDPSDFATAPPSETPSALPSVSPSAGPQRINVLLMGVDSGVGRNTALTDTMIVASLDPVGKTVSMISVPRDMVNVPLPDGRQYKEKINGLDAFARHNPKLFPGSNGTGHDVLMAALGTLLNIKINYYAAVNLQGFVNVVDRLGGVDVNVAHGFCDPTYDQYGYTNGFSITAGHHHLNGYQALAYARVRKAAGESDFTRAGRQQELLNGLRDAIVKGGFIKDPVGLLRAIGQTLSTNVPRSLLPDLADDMSGIGRNQTYRAVIDHPLVAAGSDYRGSIQLPNYKAILALSAQMFTVPGTLPAKTYAAPPASSGGGGGSGVSNCAPAATPTPKPTPKPTPHPSPSPSPAVTASPTVEESPSP
jgi:polyisoprenyl-teichoic acid--peptidoglycan teichoic acid transferase